jgi:hypothetical protein
MVNHFSLFMIFVNSDLASVQRLVLCGPAGVLPVQAAQGPKILGAPNFRIFLIWRPINFMRGGKLAKELASDQFFSTNSEQNQSSVILRLPLKS